MLSLLVCVGGPFQAISLSGSLAAQLGTRLDGVSISYTPAYALGCVYGVTC